MIIINYNKFACQDGNYFVATQIGYSSNGGNGMQWRERLMILLNNESLGS